MVKTIRQQMLELCEQYKRAFKEKCGIELIAFPSIIPINVSFQKLRDKVIEYTGKDPLNIDTREAGYVEARRFFCVIAEQMGYKPEDTMEYLKQDRTNYYNHLQRHEALKGSKSTTKANEYIERFNKFLNTLYEEETRGDTSTMEI